MDPSCHQVFLVKRVCYSLPELLGLCTLTADHRKTPVHCLLCFLCLPLLRGFPVPADLHLWDSREETKVSVLWDERVTDTRPRPLPGTAHI